MFVRVAPTDISFDDRWLTYFMKDSFKEYLHIWSLVTIPIRNMISYWVIIDFEEKSEYEDTKSAIDIACSFPLLSNYQIEAMSELSKRYCIPIHKVLNLFMPKFIFSNLEKSSFEPTYDLDYKVFPTKQEKWSRTLLHITSESDFLAKLRDIIFNDSSISTVVIFPDDFSIDDFISRFPEIEKEIMIFKNSLTYSKKIKIFLQALSKEKNIMIWTRKILQYNLARYSRIISVEDSFIRHIYNQSEKYLYSDVLDAVYNAWSFELIHVTSQPSTSLVYKAKKMWFEYKTCI